MLSLSFREQAPDPSQARSFSGVLGWRLSKCCFRTIGVFMRPEDRPFPDDWQRRLNINGDVGEANTADRKTGVGTARGTETQIENKI